MKFEFIFCNKMGEIRRLFHRSQGGYFRHRWVLIPPQRGWEREREREREREGEGE